MPWIQLAEGWKCGFFWLGPEWRELEIVTFVNIDATQLHKSSYVELIE